MPVATNARKNRAPYILVVIGLLMSSLVFPAELIATEATAEASSQQPVENGETAKENETPTIPAWRLGLGAGIWVDPEQKEFVSDGRPVDLFFDHDLTAWIKFRIGYSASEAGYAYDRFVSDGKTSKTATIKNRLRTTSVYLAYRYAASLARDLDVFALCGAAYIKSTLRVDYELDMTTDKDSGTGLATGIGIQYGWDDFGVGGQYFQLNRKGNFSDAMLRVGSRQIQLFVFYRF
ncbi:MAG: porin family protein [Proteobacteria bacterium]|nr:porin family protein [Pseudomonadota bacterium]